MSFLTELLTPAAPVRSEYQDDNSFHAAWLDWRRTGIGGSDSGIIAGVAPRSYGSRLKIQWEKLGWSNPEPPSVAMRRGHALESLIGELFQEEYKEELGESQVLARHPDYPFMISSIDWARKQRGIVEAKSINSESAKRYGLGPTGDVQSLMMWWQTQGQHNMAVYGVDMCVFAVLVDDESRFYELERDQKVIDNLIEIYAEFWDEHILQQKPVREFSPRRRRHDQ